MYAPADSPGTPNYKQSSEISVSLITPASYRSINVPSRALLHARRMRISWRLLFALPLDPGFCIVMHRVSCVEGGWDCPSQVGSFSQEKQAEMK